MDQKSMKTLNRKFKKGQILEDTDDFLERVLEKDSSFKTLKT